MAGAADAIRRNVELWADKRMCRMEKTPTHAEAAYTCDICGRTFEAVIGLTSHLCTDINSSLCHRRYRQTAKEEEEVAMDIKGLSYFIYTRYHQCCI